MDEQDKLLETATAVVREQAYFMKKAIEQDNLRDALKFSSNMICELRTSALTPRFYYELYMLIFQELQHLASFFSDKTRHGKKLTELYESVQHAGNILPRLYLLITVGVAYIQSKEAPGSEILRDMAELCKGVQHPIRGLFLRYYLLQMTKDRLQDVAEESGLGDVCEFILGNFTETTRLWIRLSNQNGVAGQRDRVKRERERYDLRLLVGASLVRLSQLDGMTKAFYTDKVLPKILEQVIESRDTMAQQYLLDCTVQVFPDDFHIGSLQLLLSTCSQTQKSVDLRPVLINLMNRLRNYLQQTASSASVAGQSSAEVFALFRTHLEKIMHRSSDAPTPESDDPSSSSSSPVVPVTNTQSVDSPAESAAKSCGSMLELFQAFLGFTLSLDPKRYDQVSIVHGMALAALDKYIEAVSGLPAPPSSAKDDQDDEDDEPAWLYPLIEIIETTVSTVPLSAALALSQFGSLLSAVPKQYSKKVSVAMIDSILESMTDEKLVGESATLTRFMTSIDSLLFDSVSSGPVKSEEQVRVCKIMHIFYNSDTDIQYELLNNMRTYFGRGGSGRLRFTLPTIVSIGQSLVQRVHARDSEGEKSHQISTKKVFQFLHATILALVPVAPELAFRFWLSTASISDKMGEAFEAITHEFFVQALITFEEEMTDSKSQMNGISGLVGVLINTTSLLPENYDAIATKCTQHGARLLKKIDQCRAVLCCSNLFWSNASHDSKRVVECLQRSLKIADICVQATPSSSVLFVECLNKYIYYFEKGVPEITGSHIANLIALCQEHAKYAREAVVVTDKNSTENIGAHLNQTVAYIRAKAVMDSGSPLNQIKIPGEHVQEVENTPPVPKSNAADTVVPKVDTTRGE